MGLFSNLPSLMSPVIAGGGTAPVTGPVTGPGPTPPPAAPSSAGEWKSFGLFMAVTGALTNLVGTYFDAEMRRGQLKSQALSMQFEETMAAHAARAAEQDAQATIDASQSDIGILTMRAGAEKASRKVAMAARGLRLGVGSTAEVQATGDLVKEIDRKTISLNAAMNAAARRTEGSNMRTRSIMAGVSAQNLEGTRRSINPYMSAGSSLLSSASKLGDAWVTDRRSSNR